MYHEAGIEALKKEIHPKIGEIVDEFFRVMVSGRRVKTEADWQKVPGGKRGFDRLMGQIIQIQKRVIEEYQEPKAWSRATHIFLAGKRENIQISPREAVVAADIYWRAVNETSVPYPHAVDFLQTLQRLKRPVYFLTSSDCILKVNEGGEFVYDPEYSRDYKIKRIEPLREKGLLFSQVITGDPIDKPRPEFFRLAIKLAEKDLGRKVDPAEIVAIGDSYGSDIEVPLQLGFGAGVLLKPGEISKRKKNNFYIVSTLPEIETLLS